MKLVLTHTPAQAKTLTDILGEGWRVEPCDGMVRDLPTDKLGIDLDNDFHPTFTVVPGKRNPVRRLMKAVRDCEAVYAATPPTLDGEAMAWHVLALSPDAKDKLVYRAVLPTLTPDAIRAAFAAPRPLDMRQVEAYLTRRIIERLIAWSVNAQARRALGFTTALSHDGMVALRLIAAYESTITAFTPQTGWRVSVTFVQDGVRFIAQVLNAKGVPLTMRNEEQARQLELLLRHGAFWVDKAGQGAHIRVGATAGKPYPIVLHAAHTTLTESDVLRIAEVVVETVTHEPPRPFTRAALIGALVDAGLSVEGAGTTLEGLLAADYLSGDERLTLTAGGRAVSAYLTEAFDELTSPAYAAQLRADITRIASGECTRLEGLRAFWSRFGAVLQPASRTGQASAPKPIVLRPAEEG
jgi:DNA topoisomerase IA